MTPERSDRGAVTRPHVGFITESFLDSHGRTFEGGAERHLLSLATVASELGAQVTVYQRSHGNWERIYEGVKVVAQPAPLASLGRVLARRAVADNCTHLHFQYLERVPWGLSGPTLTATSHGIYWDTPYDDKYRAWYPGGRLGGLGLPAWRLHQRNRCLLAVGRCKRVLSVDTSLLRLVQSHRPELRERVEVVMNFTDLADDQGAGPDTPGTDACLQPLLDARRQGHTVVLVPRNLSLVRGGGWLPDLAERAVATLPPGNQCDFFLTGVAVDVYGQAKRYTTLLQRELQSRSEAARASMHLLGGLPHSAMAAAYRASDIVLIPTFACEGTSLAALEAMGLGVPVVATNVGGLNDIVRDGVTGFLVPPDPQALASAVARLAENSELRLRLGAEGRRMVAGAFTREHWRTRAEGFACRAGWASAN